MRWFSDSVYNGLNVFESGLRFRFIWNKLLWRHVHTVHTLKEHQMVTRLALAVTPLMIICARIAGQGAVVIPQGTGLWIP